MPAVADGTLPPGTNIRIYAPARFFEACREVGTFSAGLEARLHVSQDGRRYISGPALALAAAILEKPPGSL